MPPQSIAGLTSMGEQYAPLAAGITPSMVMPFQGVPFLGQGVGQMLTFLPPVQSALTAQFNRAGMTPLGVGHDQNVYDRIKKMQFTQLQMQAMQQSAESDRQSFLQTFRGVAAVTGTPYGAEQRRAAEALSNFGVMAAPILSHMAPDFLDQMGGIRGSATVMAKHMSEAGRYRLDPLTGRMGMSADSLAYSARSLHNELFSRDELAGMRGITAGNVGSLIKELQSRGMVETAATQRGFGGYRGADPRSDIARVAAQMGHGENLSAADLDKLSLDPQVADKIRQLDVGRIKTSVKAYTNAIAAVRDIFGDAGRPNAPMNELMQALEALTLNQGNQIDPGRMSMLVRNTHNLAKNAGISVDTAAALQAHAASRAQALGLEPIFGITANQGAMAFGTAYRGMGMAGVNAWGAMSADQLQQLDSNLRTQAAGSNAANRAATAIRLGQQFGGFQEGTAAARLVQALQTGQDMFDVDGKGNFRSVNMQNDQEFISLMSGARTRSGGKTGITAGDIQSMLGQRDVNREFIQKYGIDSIVRRRQWDDELAPFVSGRMQETLTARLADTGADFGKSSQMSQKISRRVIDRMMQMSQRDFSDSTTRNDMIGSFIDEELKNAGGADLLKLTGDERKAFMSMTANRFYGAWSAAIKQSGYSGFVNPENMYRANNKMTLDAADAAQMKADFDSRMGEAMSGLGSGTILSRAVDALRDVREDDPEAFTKVLAGAMGGVSTNEINRRLVPEMRRVQDQRKRVEQLQEQIMKEKNPNIRAQLRSQYDSAYRELLGQVNQLAKTGETYGMTGDSVTSVDIGRGVASTRNLIEVRNNLAGLSGAFGNEVSDDQLNRMRASGENKIGSKEDAMAAYIAQKGQDAEAIARHLQDPKNALEKRQSDLLSNTIAELRKDSAYNNFNDSQISTAALQLIRDRVGVFDEQAAQDAFKQGQVVTDAGQLRAITRKRRRMVPTAATDAEVEQILKASGNTVSWEEARQLANSKLLARRLGVDEAEIEAEFSKNYSKAGYVQGRLGAIDALFAGRAARQYDVTDADVQELYKLRPDLKSGPTVAQIEEYKRKTGFKGTDAEAKTAMERTLVLQHRVGENNARFDHFWGSVGGAAFRERVEQGGQDAADVADKLIQSNGSVQKYGSRALEYADALKSGQQRLRELAQQYAGGDIAKLQAGNYSLDLNDPNVKKTSENVTAEVARILESQRGIFAALGEQQLSAQRQFQLGDYDQVAADTLQAAVDVGLLSSEDRERIAKDMPSRDVRHALYRDSLMHGSDENISAATGFRNLNDPNLTMANRTVIAAARYGAKSEDAVISLVGRDKWDTLTQSERTALAAKLRKGGLSKEEAMKTLGVSAEQYERFGDEQQRVDYAMLGLGSDAFIRKVTGLGNKKDTEFTSAEMDLYETFREGRSSINFARHKKGMTKDSMPANIAAIIQQGREEIGNAEEAFRLLGFDANKELTPEQIGKLKTATYDVGVARRLTREQATLVNKYASAKIEYDKASAVAAATGGVGSPKMEELKAKLAEAENAVQPIVNYPRIGVTKSSDLLGAADVETKLTEMQQQAVRNANVNPGELTRDILKRFGFKTGTELTGRQQRIAGLLEGTGRDFGQRVVASDDFLKSMVSKKIGGPMTVDQSLSEISSFADKYFEASRSKDSVKKLADLQTEYKFRDKDGTMSKENEYLWRRAENDVRFQQYHGLLKIGRGAGGQDKGEESFEEIARRNLRGDVSTQQSGQGGTGMPSEMKLSGTVKLVADMLDMGGAWGGARWAQPPGGY